MASGFPSGGGDFYNTAGFGGGGVGASGGMINNVQLQYRQQQQLQHLDQFSSIPPRRTPVNFMAKRSISELEKQQQQQQAAALLRSVKQRNQYNHTSPISPLTPFDFSSSLTGQTPYSSSHHPHLQQLRSSFPTNPTPNNNLYNSTGYSFSSGISNSTSVVPTNRVLGVEKEGESDKKMKNKLQELEKQLLDDNDDDDGDVVSVVTSSEWSETMQNLLTSNQTQTQNQTQNHQNQQNSQNHHNHQNQQKPFSPSPTSSSSSSSSSSYSSTSPSTSPKQSFIDIANAISEGNTEIATIKLDHLNQISNPRGDSEQRFIAYMVSALRSRLNPTESPPPVIELSSIDQIMTTQMLYEASPCFKLGFMASNLAILEATRDQPTNIHLLDFDIGQGSQYISLIHAIAERQQSKGIPIMIRITSVLLLDSCKEEDQRIVGDRLKKLADRVGISFKFNVVIKPINGLNQESLSCEPNEALVVNFAYFLYKLSDESVSTENPRDELLRLVKSLNPRVVTVVEQEMNCNTAPFVARVAEVSSYYLGLFNSLDSTMTREGPERVRIEECLGRKAANSVACEGRERVERCEVFGKWRARMRMAGFVSRPLGQHVADSMKARLNSVYRNNPGFTVKEEADGVCFGWNDRLLTVASAWC